MPSNLSSYLAAHYLTTDSKPTKKRKRKHTTDDGLVIKDDDDADWLKPSRADGADADPDDPENAVAIAGTSADFRRTKKSNWKTVGATETRDAEAAAADAILASAAAETEAARAADDEAPVIEGAGTLPPRSGVGGNLKKDTGDTGPDGGGSVAMMSDGTHAGLQSAAAISAQLRRRQEEERAELARLERERANAGDSAPEEQLVLRDATGRRVDASLRRAELRRAAAEAEEKARREEAERKRALMGEVQLEEARRRRERLEDAAVMPLARSREDRELNAELKAQRRWNDPMAQFLGDGDDGAGGSTASTAKKGSKLRRPVYKGPAPPNRYGIRPGYRWDGVDRSNGFEAERFKAINRRERLKGLDYAWQMDE